MLPGLLPGLESQVRETGRCGLIGLCGAPVVVEAVGAALKVDKVGMAEEDLEDKCPGRWGRRRGRLSALWLESRSFLSALSCRVKSTVKELNT